MATVAVKWLLFAGVVLGAGSCSTDGTSSGWSIVRVEAPDGSVALDSVCIDDSCRTFPESVYAGEHSTHLSEPAEFSVTVRGLARDAARGTVEPSDCVLVLATVSATEIEPCRHLD